MYDRRQALRDVVVMVIAALACPGALFAGAILGCATEGFDATCAMEGILFSPFLLGGAGVVAGLLTSGWRGLAVMLFGVLLGMTLILLMSFVAGTLVPIDPFSGIIATTWFALPMTVGFVVGRGISWVWVRATA